MYSLERRRERYIIMQVWKMLENKVPDDLNIKLQSSISSRRGRTCLVHKLASTPSHLQKAKQQTVRCFGIKIFNALPKPIRNITNVDTDQFKSALDHFLEHVEDKPLLRSAANNGMHSNHLYDILNSPLEVIEQEISGPQIIPQPGDANDMPRRRTAVRLAISRI